MWPKGRPRAESTRAKIGAANRRRTPETRAKIAGKVAASLRGRPSPLRGRALLPEQRAKLAAAKRRHGHATSHRNGGETRTYRSWRAMVARCLNPKSVGWKDYGGRGIAVCARWRDFAGFLADMGERPPALTLDRIDPDGHYEPGNCRWATPTEQWRNRRQPGGGHINGHISGKIEADRPVNPCAPVAQVDRAAVS